MHFIGLTVESYCSVLCQIANSPAQVYWCQNKANRTFLFLNPEQLANDRSGEYRKISYREIVLIGRALSEKLVFSEVHAKTVSETLRQMADRKKEKRNSTLCALYQEIFDRFANRQEFIYESTGVICKRVIETMEEISRKSSEVNPAESNKILQEQEAPSALSPSSPPSKKLPVQSNSEKPKEIHRKPLVVNIASGPKAPVIETDSQGTSLAERKLRYSQSCTIPSCTKPSSDLPRAQKMNPLKEYLENENCSAAIKTQLFNRLNNFEFAGEKRLKDASPEEQANYFRSLTPENIQHYTISEN